MKLKIKCHRILASHNSPFIFTYLQRIDNDRNLPIKKTENKVYLPIIGIDQVTSSAVRGIKKDEDYEYDKKNDPKNVPEDMKYTITEEERYFDLDRIFHKNMV